VDVQAVLGGDRRALSRCITLVENGGETAQQILAALHPHTGRAHIVGITGPPGTGKSTLVARLAAALRQRHLRVGIIAVDPSSPFTGGALLGDRLRMQNLAGDPGVFIRSMATRGSLGGLARATGDVVSVLDAAGFDVVLVETVGTGQAEVDIAQAAHTVIVVVIPGMGDDVQVAKAGVLEIASIFVVNKADREGADRCAAELRLMSGMGAAPEGWAAPILMTVATRGEGAEEVVEAIISHKRSLQQTGLWESRVLANARRRLLAVAQDLAWRERMASIPSSVMDDMVRQVATYQTDPYTAARELLATTKGKDAKTAGVAAGGDR
jgi:LAO/AO transport system kinase